MSRGRGCYGSFDRDRHWVAGWAVDRATDYARDRTIGAAARAALPIVEDVSRARRGATRWWCASREIGGRSEAERPVTEIGQELFHTVSSRERAILQLSTGFPELVNDLAMWQTEHMNAPDAVATVQWFASDVIPTLDEWFLFAARAKGSWWRTAAISWDTFENWMLRLRQLRALARAHGIVLQSAEPIELPKTVWQRTEEGNGSEAMALLGVLKIGAASVIAVIGAIGVYTALRDFRARRAVHSRAQQEGK